MRSDPIIGTRYRPINDGDGSSIRRLGDKTLNFSGSHVFENFSAILRWVALQGAHFAALVDDVDERGAWLPHIRRQGVHGAILIVADDKVSVHVEHDDALGHVVAGDSEQAISGGADQAHPQYRHRYAGNGDSEGTWR